MASKYKKEDKTRVRSGRNVLSERLFTKEGFVALILILLFTITLQPDCTEEQRPLKRITIEGDSLRLMAKVQGSMTESSENLDLRLFIFGKIPINIASIDHLITIPGVGVKTAIKIIEQREKGGAYLRDTDLHRVEGISVKKAQKISPYLSFESEYIKRPE